MSLTAKPTKALELFYSYAHNDEKWRKKLETHLSTLQRQKFITGWHDRNISAGTEWATEIDTHLNTAHIILLLISPDFISSEYCYSVEMMRAMERHKAGEAHVIPIILRPTDCKGTPFEQLQALPTNAKPVTRWPDRDEALLNVANGIRRAVEELTTNSSDSQLSSDTRLADAKKGTFPLQIWNVPYQRNPFFTGREDILTYLYDKLNTDQTAALTQPQAISGLGGIGKTQTAVEFAYRYRENYEAILWVKADSHELLVSDFVSIAGELSLPEKDIQVQSKVVDAVKRWLKIHSHWLLIFDNADDIAMLYDFLPLGSNQWC
ncbi:MAG: TIR domain-containing protein [Ktedonobacteraceae bacterium]